MNNRVSVIIATYNGATKLPRLLEALPTQTFSDFELIVVVDGSTDNTLEVLKPFSKRFINFRIISQKNSGRSKARNRGAAETTGDILIFYDDDMEPKENSIAQHIQFHQNNEGMVCGLPLEIVSPKHSDILNYKATRAAGWIAEFPQVINRLELEKLFFTTSNCSVKKRDFIRLNGFDERLTDAEDFDLAYRAIQSGTPAFFDKQNIAIHHERATCQSYIERTRQYQHAQQTLRSLHPDRSHSMTPAKLGFAKNTLYWFFNFSIWVWAIDKTMVLRLLPKTFRFKIYDWVIYSQGVVHAPKSKS